MGTEIPFPAIRVYCINLYFSRVVFIRCPLGIAFSWKFERSLHILAPYSLRRQDLSIYL